MARSLRSFFDFKEEYEDDGYDEQDDNYDDGYGDYADERNNGEAAVFSQNVAYAKSQELSIIVHAPRNFNDCLVIIDNIKNNNPVVFSLEGVDDDFGQRMIDLLSGAAHAISGELKQISVNSDKIFLLAPALVNIDASMIKEIDKDSKQVFSAVDIKKFAR
ncbi:MAG: cell division protein SepF [Lachnospirales bacterium]